MVITIDGPAGAGKSTVARQLARALGFEHLDTGALYRVVTAEALRRGIPWADEDGLAAMARSLRIEFREEGGTQRVYADGVDVSEAIRTPEVTRNIYHVADCPALRRALNEVQRRYAEGRHVVTEGRDQGTEVFPHAEVKFYLDAPVEVRARRRMADYERAGRRMAIEEVVREVADRDLKDRSRPMGALRCAPDAIVIDSGRMDARSVVAAMVEAVRGKQDRDGMV